MVPLTTLEVIVRLMVAALLCAAVGFEREYHRKPAGIRTNMLVGIGTAVMTIASIEMAQLSSSPASVNISQLAAAVITGIGFIGAGAIIHARGAVHGLTTAASIWVVASIGIVSGMGLYHVAVVATVLTMVILAVLRGVQIPEESETK
jgi:putative Mg2+ transporter-C (MgtC) family protein